MGRTTGDLLSEITMPNLRIADEGAFRYICNCLVFTFYVRIPRGESITSYPFLHRLIAL